MPARGTQKKPTGLQIRTIRPSLPGPWQYADLLPLLTLVQNRLRAAPPLAYPVVALVVWRTMQNERKRQAEAILDAHREAIRRDQRIYIVKPARRKRFLLF